MASFLKKASLLMGAVLLFVCPLLAEDYTPQVIGPFGTLNNYDNPLTIPANKAQDLLNVDISPGGRSIKKRKGFETAFTMSITTSAMHSPYRFYNSSAEEVILLFNDTRITVSINGNSPSVLTSTMTNNLTWQCIDYAGFAYCVNSDQEGILQTDGATFTFLTGVSSGTIITSTPDRMVISGNADAPNRIDFSKSGTITDFALPFLEGTDANQITISAPGSKITHVTYAFDRIFWFKDNSFGYINIDNTSLANWQIVTVSPTLGTLDNSSVYWEDVLYFRGQDGHIYAYNGASYVKMTRDITGSVNDSQIVRTNSWTQSTSAEFGAGSFDPSVYADTITASGSLQLTFPDAFLTFRDGDDSSKKVWISSNSGSSTGLVDAIDYLTIVNYGSALGRVYVRTAEPLTNIKAGPTYYFTIRQFGSYDTTNLVRFYLVVSSNTSATTNPDSLSSNFQVVLISTYQSAGNIPYFHLSSISSTNDGVLYSSSPASALSFTEYATIHLFLSTSAYTLTIRNSDSLQTVISGTHTYTGSNGCNPYIYLTFMNGAAVQKAIFLDNFGVFPASTTWNSQVNNVDDMTAWNSFLATYQNQNGGNTFYLRSSTDSFTVDSSTPAWNAVTVGAIPTLSTGTYFQIRDVMTYNFSSIYASTGSISPRLDDVTVQWQEGSATDKAYGQYFEDSIWWSVQLGDDSTYNNYVYRYDMINNGWVLYDIPTNGFFIRNNQLYFGSSSGGYVYKYGDVNNDAGSAINAYWKSGEYFGASPFNDKEIKVISVSAVREDGSDFDVTYTLNGSNSATYNVDLDTTKTMVNSNKTLPLGKIGNTYNVKVGNNASDKFFEINAIMLGINEKSWRTTP